VPSCARCGSTGKLKCSTCSGSGKVQSKWFKSLKDWTVEKLRFERETRLGSIATDQQEIRSLKSEISDLNTQLKEMEDYWEDQLNQNSYFTKVEGGAPAGLDGLPRAIGRLESQVAAIRSQISESKEELAAIEEVIRAKLG
jgi:predicted  nucleic acid-binding Zn-ribbon protein